METSNIRIICLVQNQTMEETGNESKGLYHTFKNKTNDFIKTFLFSEGCNEIFLGNDNNPCYLLISNGGVTRKKFGELTKEDKWEILFIHDSIDPDKYHDFIFDKNTLLMYHQTPSISELDSIRSVTIRNLTHELLKGKKGRHEPTKSGGYALLFELSEAWELQDNKQLGFTPKKYEAAKQGIINWFGLNAKLNAALEFLHQSLGNSQVSKSILTEPDCFSEDELEVQEKNIETKEFYSINTLIIKLQNHQITNPNYYPTLRIIRDRLLAKAGVG